MALATQDTMLLGTHGWFYRSGDVVTVVGNYTGADVGAASKTRKPGATDPLWIPMGAVEASSDGGESTDLEVWKPSPGALVRGDITETKKKLTIKLTVNEISAFIIEMIYSTLPLTAASTQFNPLEGGSKKGWLKVQRYNENNVLTLTLDVWVRLKITNEPDMGGSDFVKAEFSADVIHSILNTGTL